MKVLTLIAFCCLYGGGTCQQSNGGMSILPNIGNSLGLGGLGDLFGGL